MQAGWALCADYYSRAGQKVKDCKYTQGEFSQELVDAASKFLKGRIEEESIDCVVPVPSIRRPYLVPDFARRLAQSLAVAYIEAVQKTCEAEEQKNLLNSMQQQRNIEGSTAVTNGDLVSGHRVLLVDDMVDSRWTFTVVAAKLLEAGAERVYPFALVRTGSGD